MRHIYFYLCVALLICGCGMGELHRRDALLRKLATTNAALSTVEAKLGSIYVYRKDSADWKVFRNVFTRYNDAKSKRILEKIDKFSAVGFSSTPSMQTFVFLNEEGRLVDFDVDSQ